MERRGKDEDRVESHPPDIFPRCRSLHEKGYIRFMLVSRKMLQRILGALWLIDGLLQLQPQMFTMNMVNGVMKPMLQGQPGFVEPSLQFIISQTALHLTAVNLLIVVVQVLLGLGFLVLSDRFIKPVVLVSIVWALIVWYGGEGMSMLFTGQASIFTGAPGAVLLYPLLGLVIWPRPSVGESGQAGGNKAGNEGLISRQALRVVLAGFWIFAALLQLQPNWWQAGQISQAIGAMVGQGGLNTVLVDPVLQHISDMTAKVEIPLNIILILVFLALSIALAVIKNEQVRPFLIASIVLSVVFWYLTEAFGMILTGMATDFNSGLLVVVIALACWPTFAWKSTGRARFVRSVQEAPETRSPQTV
jgi:hypothetical protein